MTRTATLSIRGTKTVDDMLTNLHCTGRDFLGGYAHSGMAEAAVALRDDLLPYMADAAVDSIVIVGHSYGAAVATLLTLLMRKENENLSEKVRDNLSKMPKIPTRMCLRSVQRLLKEEDLVWTIQIRCFAFAPPPCIAPSLQKLALDANVYTVVLGSDLVPRLSERSFDKLIHEISDHNWRGSSHASAHFVFPTFHPPMWSSLSLLTPSSFPPLKQSTRFHLLRSPQMFRARQPKNS